MQGKDVRAAGRAEWVEEGLRPGGKAQGNRGVVIPILYEYNLLCVRAHLFFPLPFFFFFLLPLPFLPLPFLPLAPPPCNVLYRFI